MPGVAYWVHRLHEQGWLQAVASSAPRLNVELILQSLGTAQCFQAVVSGEDVDKGKPDPEVYLTAASRLGAPPSKCVVVEDAFAGVEGARSAGMPCIAVSRSGRHLPADVVVRSLDLLDAGVFDSLVADFSQGAR